MNKIKIEISGRVPSKKNNRRAIYVNGRTIMIANKNYDQWHRDAGIEINIQRPKRNIKVKKIILTFYIPNRLRRDLTNMAESVMDLLVDLKVIADDNIFEVPELDLRFGGVDKDKPRVIIEIMEMTEI